MSFVDRRGDERVSELENGATKPASGAHRVVCDAELHGSLRPLAAMLKHLHNYPMLIALLVLIATVLSVLLTASAVAAACRFTTKSSALSVVMGTLAVPALICSSFVYWTVTMEVNDASPGNVLIGTAIALAVVAPVAFVASRLTMRFMSRGALQNVG